MSRFTYDYTPVPNDSVDDYLIDDNKWQKFPAEDAMGISTVSGTVKITKNKQNMVGISIGGGSPYCPCAYVVQVYEGTPARQSILTPGDEICGVNGKSVKGRSKNEIVQMILAFKDEVTLHYNKLEFEAKQGKSIDMALKKIKHRLVESLNSSTADALGLSRAILCNDSLVKKLKFLEDTADLYKGLIRHCKVILRLVYQLSECYQKIGNVFAETSCKEPQPAASEAFSIFGETHRRFSRYSQQMLAQCAPLISDLNVYLYRAIPDTKLTVKKYLDAKFEYLSYCLKVKEMDDEEAMYWVLKEPLYRVDSGNYEYRLILRCRHEAREKFAKRRSDVMVKLELLDSHKVQNIVGQLQTLVEALATYHTNCHREMRPHARLFPVEIKFEQFKSFTAGAAGDSGYNNATGVSQEDDEECGDGEEEERSCSEEESESSEASTCRPQQRNNNVETAADQQRRHSVDSTTVNSQTSESTSLLSSPPRPQEDTDNNHRLPSSSSCTAITDSSSTSETASPLAPLPPPILPTLENSSSNSSNHVKKSPPNTNSAVQLSTPKEREDNELLWP